MSDKITRVVKSTMVLLHFTILLVRLINKQTFKIIFLCSIQHSFLYIKIYTAKIHLGHSRISGIQGYLLPTEPTICFRVRTLELGIRFSLDIIIA